MFIAVKDSKVLAIHEVEWECRRIAKGLSHSEYWTWVDSVTTISGTTPDEIKTYDFSGEDYEIVHIEELNITEFYESNHIKDSQKCFLKWDGTKIIKDDTAKATWELAEEWKRIRERRTTLLAETDWVVIKARENGGQVPAAWKTYRVALRDIPSEQSDKTKYSEITWPTRPE